MVKEFIPPSCEGCHNWGRFKHECWVFWDGKKDCTQHTSVVQESMSAITNFK
ncbi:hypothetical protein ACFLZX_05000 [Nanoarchaeota archaeon]